MSYIWILDDGGWPTILSASPLPLCLFSLPLSSLFRAIMLSYSFYFSSIILSFWHSYRLTPTHPHPHNIFPACTWLMTPPEPASSPLPSCFAGVEIRSVTVLRLQDRLNQLPSLPHPKENIKKPAGRLNPSDASTPKPLPILEAPGLC